MYHKKRKKSTSHRRHHRRRRVSGIKDLNPMMILAVIGGGVAGRILYNKLSTSTNTTFSKLAAYSGVIVGLALQAFTKSPLFKAIGMGLVATGGVNMLIGLNVISGIENPIVSGYKLPYRKMGYPLNAIPANKVAGLVDGHYVSKPNFSGSGLPQAQVIGGISGYTSGAANPGY